MYTRGYRPTQGADAPRSETAQSEVTPVTEPAPESTEAHTEPPEKAQKRRYRARRNMPEFKREESEKNADNRTPEPPKDFPDAPTVAPHTHSEIFTHDELFILALTALLMLEGSDDILVLALGFILCP